MVVDLVRNPQNQKQTKLSIEKKKERTKRAHPHPFFFSSRRWSYAVCFVLWFDFLPLSLTKFFLFCFVKHTTRFIIIIMMMIFLWGKKNGGVFPFGDMSNYSNIDPICYYSMERQN